MSSKKIFIYELKPRYFKDSTHDGYGDLAGLAEVSDYFHYLQVDYISLPNLLQTPLPQEQSNARLEHLLKDHALAKLTAAMRIQKVKVLVEINLQTIAENYEQLQKIAVIKQVDDQTKSQPRRQAIKFSQKQAQYVAHDSTQELLEQWNAKTTIVKFTAIIIFFAKSGVNGFIFTGFDRRPKKVLDFSVQTCKYLQQFYEIIKKINPQLLVIAEASKLNKADLKMLLTFEKKAFDYFKNQTLALLGTSAQYGIDQIGKYTPKLLVKKLRLMTRYPQQMITFSAQSVGRYLSRWGNDQIYHNESAKAFAMLLMAFPNAVSYYYGAEIGMKNLTLNQYDHFQDATLNARFRKLQTSGLKWNHFIEAQILQNPLHSHTVMQWNTTLHGGFSQKKQIAYRANKETLATINVERQYHDPNSILNFYRTLRQLHDQGDNEAILNNGTSEIKITHAGRGVIVIKRVWKQKSVLILINLTTKYQKAAWPHNAKILLSSYQKKQYKVQKKLLLAPFEAIMLRL